LEIIDKVLKSSPLSEYINLKADEIVSSYNCVKQLSIEGRIDKKLAMDANQLQNKISEAIFSKLGSNYNMKEFWLVQIGLKQGETFKGLDSFDKNGEKFRIEHKEGEILIIDFWSIWNDLDNYLMNNLEIMKKNKRGTNRKCKCK